MNRRGIAPTTSTAGPYSPMQTYYLPTVASQETSTQPRVTGAHWRSFLAGKTGDVLAIAGISVVAAGVSQPFTGLDTPDSSFYLSLATHGDDVTDRAPEPSYYWTRVGHISAMRVPILFFGPETGLQIYRFLLLTVIITAAYLILRQFTARSTTIILTSLLALSTVILSYVGNTHHSSSVLPGVMVALAAALLSQRRPWLNAAVAGAVVGWLTMVSPYGAVMAGTLWLALMIHRVATTQNRTRVARQALLGFVPAVMLVFAAHLQLGRIVFPEMNWLATYLEWNAKLDYSVYASSDPVWLQDISLLVPLSALLVTVWAWHRNRESSAAQSALILALTTVGFFFVYAPFMGRFSLEAPMYQATIWPPMTLALSLAAASYLSNRKLCGNEISLGAVSIVMVYIAGTTSPGFGLGAGVAIAAVSIVIASFFITKPALGTIGAVAVLAITGQMLQNSRGDLGLYYLSPYAWSLNANPIGEKVRSMLTVQEWLIQNTEGDDQILLWVDGPWTQGDRELYAVAGMQLWGENRLTLEPRLTDEFGINQLETYKPTVIAMYGKGKEAVIDFWSSLPSERNPSAPQCIDFDWPISPVSDFPADAGVACVTRLNW